MAQYDRGIWDWSILEGCFGNTKISPTDIDGCVERKGKKLFLETKLPGIEIPNGQARTLYSLVDDGHTVLIVWGENDTPQRLRIITPYYDETQECDLETLRSVVSKWFAMAEDAQNKEQIDPARMARAFWRRRGRAYCDIMQAEWARLDALEKRSK
jgi:hypothetical protein